MAKVVQCKTCGADIAKSAKVCPRCGAKQRKHTVLGVIFVVLGILLIAAAIGNDESEPKKTGDSTPPQSQSESNKGNEQKEEPPIEITARELWSAYDENEVNADNLYKKKTISVTGTVFEIGKDLLTDTPFIALKAGDSLGIYAIQCFFQDSSENEKISAVKDGDTVSIVGTCNGKSINVMLRDCTIKTAE